MDTDTQELLEGSIRLGIFFHLGLDQVATGEDPLLLWLGVNPMPAKIPDVDADGATYIGAGRLINVPDLEVLINGIFDRVEFRISGVPVDHSNMLEVGAPPVLGAPVYVAISPLDARWQPTGDLVPVWKGIADFWAVSQPPVTDPSSPITRQITLSCGSGDTGRSRSRRVTFTSSQQKMRYPGDKFCDRVPRYTREYMVSWPRF